MEETFTPCSEASSFVETGEATKEGGERKGYMSYDRAKHSLFGATGELGEGGEGRAWPLTMRKS